MIWLTMGWWLLMGLLALVFLWIAVRLGTLAVLKSISQFRKDQYAREESDEEASR